MSGWHHCPARTEAAPLGSIGGSRVAANHRHAAGRSHGHCA